MASPFVAAVVAAEVVIVVVRNVVVRMLLWWSLLLMVLWLLVPLLLPIGVGVHAVNVDAVDVNLLAHAKTLDVQADALHGGRQFLDEDNGIASLDGEQMAHWVWSGGW